MSGSVGLASDALSSAFILGKKKVRCYQIGVTFEPELDQCTDISHLGGSAVHLALELVDLLPDLPAGDEVLGRVVRLAAGGAGVVVVLGLGQGRAGALVANGARAHRHHDAVLQKEGL